MQHHEVFANFKQVRLNPGAQFCTNFLGAIVRKEYLDYFYAEKLAHTDRQQERGCARYPDFSEGYFEWISVLESVVQAKKRFTMFELGAGFGFHLVNAYLAVRSFHGEGFPCYLTGIEAEETHFAWLKQNFIDNHIDPKKHRLINAAVYDKDGNVFFQIGFPANYGNAVVNKLVHLRHLTEGIFLFVSGKNRHPGKRKLTLTDSKSGKAVHGFIEEKKVRAVCLKSLLAPCGCVDLIHADIQGAESKVFSSAKNEIAQKVKRVHIGTHSPEIEAGLRALFNNLGWKCLYDYPCKRTSDTAYGAIYFDDGVQVWLNRELDE
ncbi:MAG: hypothetical protein PHT31_01635 [Candidatus Omnitrophica bacterium]|nr:hypothetical protein [Candidatus Omnitrophota bacterium]MDD5652850.1 hypothetical protein [Candidatus Omnitrophota bacterium]